MYNALKLNNVIIVALKDLLGSTYFKTIIRIYVCAYETSIKVIWWTGLNNIIIK